MADEPEPNGVVKVTATTWKLGLATIGGSAVIVMGVLGAVFGNIGVAGPGQALSPVAPQATQQTVTTTTTPPVPETSAATPSVTATTPSGFMPVTKP